MRRLAFAAGIGALLSAGCSAPTEIATPRNDTGAPGDPLTVTRLRGEPYSFAYYSGMTDSVRAVMRSVPTAPAYSAGRSRGGGSMATKCTLSERSSKLSSREKNDDVNGSEYVRTAGGIVTFPGNSGKSARR